MNRTSLSQPRLDQMPAQAPYARHIFICTGTCCDPAGQARHIYRRLAHMLGELGDYANPVRVKRGVTECLGVCYGGPLLVVYPEGIWYHHVDDAALARIVDEHLGQGQPVEEYIFHRLQPVDADADAGDRAPRVCGGGCESVPAAGTMGGTA